MTLDTPTHTQHRTSIVTREDHRLAIVVGVIAFAAQLPGLFWGVPGGKSIVNAIRIMDGEVPYRDFWTMYAPGHFYLIAGLFKLFGVHIWVSGIAAQLMVAFESACLVVVSRRLGLSRVSACVVGAAFAGIAWGFRPEISSYESVLLFLLPAIDRIVAYAQGAKPAALLAAGLLCGVGAWFKHDVAFYVVSGAVLGLCVSWFVAATPRPANWVSPIGVLVRLGGGAAVGALPAIAFLAWYAGADAWRDLIQFPATDFRVVRGEGYPQLSPPLAVVQAWLVRPTDPLRAVRVINGVSSWIEGMVPQVFFVAAFVALIRRRHRLDASTAAIAIVCLTTMPFFWASAHVQHNTNFTSLWIVGTVLGAALWMRERQALPVRLAVLGLFCAHTAALLARPALEVAEIAYLWNSRERITFPAAKGALVPRARYEFYEPIVSFIREHVPESEAIYVGLARHDSVVISNQAFYYLASRPVASRYNELHPGVVDRDEVQREIIADLKRLNVRCAVLWRFGWPKPMMDRILAERREQIPELGATTLDQFLEREFETIAEYGEFRLVWRKGVPRVPVVRKVSAF